MAMTDGPVAPGCGMLWGGPYPGFSAPPFPGTRNMIRHLKNIYAELAVHLAGQYIGYETFFSDFLSCTAVALLHQFSSSYVIVTVRNLVCKCSRTISTGQTDKKEIVAGHLRSFKEQVEAAQDLEPTFVNSHSCKDYLTREMAEEFFTEAVAWAKAKGYTVHHESHRKRYLHSPWVAR